MTAEVKKESKTQAPGAAPLTEEMSRLLNTAEEGDAVAQFNLAYRYETGQGVMINLPEAVRWYEKAALQKHPVATYRLGRYCQEGKSTKKDTKRAQKLFLEAIPGLQKAAAEKDVNALNALRICYEDGWGVSQDFDQAMFWLEAESEQETLKIEQEILKAQQLLKEQQEIVLKDAEQGDATAQFILAAWYEMGPGETINLPEAVRWYEKAALQKHPMATYRLGRCCHYGEGIKKDPERAQKLFVAAMPGLKKAADIKNAIAQLALGECYQEGWVVAKNEGQAAVLYGAAAKQGNKLAQYKLGKCFATGTGVDKDEAKAVAWYRAAAKHGYALAQCHLGWCLANGIGVRKDEKQAVYWYQQAAEQGNPLALCHLARCYRYGSGAPKDEAKAVSWYQKALTHESTQAIARTGLDALFKANPDLARTAAISSPAPAAIPLESKDKKSDSLSISASLKSPPASPLAAIPAKAPLKADQEEIKSASQTETTHVPPEQKAPASLDQETLDALMALSKMPQTVVTQLQDLQREAKTKEAQLIEYRRELARLNDKVGNVDGEALKTLQGRTAELQSLIAKETDEQQAEQERQHILSEDKLSGFYYMFLRQFTGTWLACKTLQSGKIKNIEKTKLDYVAAGLDKMGKHIPGISILTDIIETAINTWSDIDKKRAVTRMADFFGTLVHTDQLIETLARRLTLQQETAIQAMQIGPQTGMVRKILQGLADAKNALTASDIDDPIKKLADKQCKLLAAAIMQGKLDHHPSLADIPVLMVPILGTASQGASPATPRPVLAVTSPGSSAKPRSAPAGLSGSLSTKGILDSMTVVSVVSTVSPLASSGPLSRGVSRGHTSAVDLQLDRRMKEQEAKMMAHLEATQAETKLHRAELARAQAQQKTLEARLQQQAEELARSKSEAEQLKQETKAIQKTLKEVVPDAPVFGSGNQAQLQASAGARSPFFAGSAAIYGELGDILGGVKDHVQMVGEKVMVQSETMENLLLTQAKQQKGIERLEAIQAEAKVHQAELAQAQAQQKALEARLQQQAEELARSQSEAEQLKQETKAIKTLKDVAPDAPVFSSGNQAQLRASAGARSPFFASSAAIHGELGDRKEQVQTVGEKAIVEDLLLTQAKQQEKIERKDKGCVIS